MTADNFDPYFKWLGIAPKDQPPTHYRLLGIDPFTDDADVISNAADRQMMLIRTFQSGQHSQISQRLLNEISTARTCLLDVRTKGDYDRALRARLGTPQFAPTTKERTVATRPPAPTGQPASQPMAVPMNAPKQAAGLQGANSPPMGTAHSPPVLDPPTAGVSYPLTPMETSPSFQPNQPLPTAKKTKRKKDSSQVLFWVVGLGLGAVLLLVIVVIGTRLAATGDDGIGAGGDIAGDNAGDITQSAVEPPGQLGGNAVLWREVGKREWSIDEKDVVAKKEMQPGAWLISRKDYKNFVVTLEYVLERDGAGGVYLRVPNDATWPWNQGLEVHFSDDFQNNDLDHESTGSIWHRTSPTKAAGNPPAQWNQVRIVCIDRDVTVEINGQEVTKYQMDPSMPRRGHIGLDGVSGGITYRNLRVQELNE